MSTGQSVPLASEQLLVLTVCRRFLDPDPELLRESANSTTNPKFHALNGALVQLVCLLGDFESATGN